MSIFYVDCQPCKGEGYFLCLSCKCKSCNGSGFWLCGHCTIGREDCPQCGASGTVAVQRPYLLFFTHAVHETCPRCSGGKKISCTVCQGTLKIPCGRCKGEKCEAKCERCRGSRKIGCPLCQGQGKLKSEWFKNLSSLSREKLLFEHEKFRAQRTNLELKLSRLDRSYDHAQNEYDTWSERARIEEWGYFDHGMHFKILKECRTAIAACQTEIKEVEEALRLIESCL
jgi:hypothetical protein